ncbi:MAG TPA: cyclomaltodextrinase C-terminal domain-containing protein [Candidatus Phocaeicola excrementigallinarum]|nr:cyclomaltodextrinase C-terminal domain-containing protein [Candidatus Phocaeicola excrementigallinarum]
MTESKTVKYHIPQQGIYMYARMRDGKTGMIVLNSTDYEQTLTAEYYKPLTKDSKTGKELSTGKTIDFSQSLTLSPRKSLVIEF